MLTGVVELSSLDGVTGFRLNSGDRFEGLNQSGAAVANAGDMNGDGFDDIVIGADRSFGTANSYVIFGKAGGFTSSIDLNTLDGANGFRLSGLAIDDSGTAVSSAGDFNGDGFSDLIIGASRANSNGISDAGKSYVVFGRAEEFPEQIELATLDGTLGFRLDGVAEDDRSGVSVSGAGDMNGDGYDDLIIGARGEVLFSSHSGIGQSYVVFGHAGPIASAIDLSGLNGINGFRIIGNAGDHFGVAVSGAGDVNGDGFADVIIGADYAGNGGESYVVFGKSGSFSPALKLSALNGMNGFRLTGAGNDDLLGRSVSYAGDVNGDGFGDLIVGASGAPSDGNDKGETFVVYGKSGGFASSISVSSLNGNNGFRINGIAEDDFSGASVSSAGDLNADGFDDLLIGAHQPFPRGERIGESYVLFGKPGVSLATISLSSLDGTNGFRIRGNSPGDMFGKSVSTAGDLNGDGFDDLIIGAPGADPHDIDRAGESYVIFGGNFLNGPETQVGDSNPNVLTATRGSNAIDLLVGGLNDDTLISDGGSDVLSGGEGNDVLSIPDADFTGTRRLLGGKGIDTVKLTGSSITLDLIAIRANQIVDVEVFDLTGTSDNTLILDYLNVINLSSHSNTIIVQRDSGDIVNKGNGWAQLANEVIDGVSFEVYTHGAAVLKVQSTATFDRFDLTQDGNINTADLSALRGQLLNKLADHSYLIPNLFDANGDGIINTADLSAVRGHLLNLLAASSAHPARPTETVVADDPVLSSFVAVPNNIVNDDSQDLIQRQGEKNAVVPESLFEVEPESTEAASGIDDTSDGWLQDKNFEGARWEVDHSATDFVFLSSEIAYTIESFS